MIYFFDELGTPDLFLLDQDCVSKGKYDEMAAWLAQVGGHLPTNGTWLGICPPEARPIFLLLLSGEA